MNILLTLDHVRSTRGSSVEQLLSRHFKKALRRPALTSMMNFRTNQVLSPFLLLQQLFYATWLNYPVVGELTYSVLTSRRAQVQDSKNWNQQRESHPIPGGDLCRCGRVVVMLKPCSRTRKASAVRRMFTKQKKMSLIFCTRPVHAN